MDPNEYQGIKKYKAPGKKLIASRSGYSYMCADPNSYSNTIVKMLEYYINKFPTFQDILDAILPKGKYRGRMKVNIIVFPPLIKFA